MSEMKRKRIALYVGQADEDYQSRVISGFLKSAFASDWDVCIFSMYHKYQDTVVRADGETNILRLAPLALFDGVVVMADTLQTAGAVKNLEKELHKHFRGPVLFIEGESKYFPSVFSKCDESIAKLTDHLITEHGYKDIAYLSGKKWHRHAKERQAALSAAMAAHGLTLEPDRIIYGDFWYTSGEHCADVLLASTKGLPDAVLCANDAMAIGLCRAFEKRGVKVPEDVAVVSYDSTFEGQTSPKRITSVLISAYETGQYAAEFLNASFEGKEPEPFRTNVKILIGESCNCSGNRINMPEFSMLRSTWDTPISECGFDSVNNSMPEELLVQPDLEGFLGTVYSYAYQLTGVESFHLCLCDPWKYMDRSNNLSIPNSGYPERMVYALRYRADHKDGLAALTETFDTDCLLPGLEEDVGHPRALQFTPLFFENNCFGYAVVDYGTEPKSYDALYRKWIYQVIRGLEGLRRFVTARSLQAQLDKVKAGKFSAMAAVYERLDDDEKEEYELVTKILDDNLLSYRFQPIVNTLDGEVYSYEALMRSATDKRVPPLSIVKYADMQNRLADVERATFRNVLKIVDDNLDRIGDAKIFINSIPGVRLSANDLSAVEHYLKKLGDTVVVELTEESELEDEDLERLKEMFKRMDVKIAVDDYGTGYSNVSNLLRYMPDYVKIDRVLLRDIQNQPQKQHFVKEVIGFCHDNGILALAEGIETTEELRACILLGADLIQGFYTGKPENDFTLEIDPRVREEIARYHEEYLHGGAVRQYVAGMTNRISLSALSRDGVSEIVVGHGPMIYKDVTVFGTPGVKTNVHIKVEAEYKGLITLENACLSNDVKNPCIELGENSDVTLVITGENVLKNTGILVPKSARLGLEGDGNLTIDLRALDFYGIGNLPAEEHGELFLALSGGTLEINGHGINGACIGSGLGGPIRIVSGSYVIDANGQTICCIGALFSDSDLHIEGCNISAEFNAALGTGIGSVTGNSTVTMSQSGLKLYGDGTRITGVGTPQGSFSSLNAENCGIYISMSGADQCGIGALSGATEVKIDMASVKIESSGSNALAVGGNEDIKMYVSRTDLKWNIKNSIDTDCYAKGDQVTIYHAATRYLHNREEVEHDYQVIE